MFYLKKNQKKCNKSWKDYLSSFNKIDFRIKMFYFFTIFFARYPNAELISTKYIPIE